MAIIVIHHKHHGRVPRSRVYAGRDGQWSNEIAQEGTSGNTVYVFRKRHLSGGEQPTIVRYAYNAGIEDLLLTSIGQALPAGFSLEGVKSHDIATLRKAAAKRKEAAKADRKRSEAFAGLGF